MPKDNSELSKTVVALSEQLGEQIAGYPYWVQLGIIETMKWSVYHQISQRSAILDMEKQQEMLEQLDKRRRDKYGLGK